MFDQQDEQNLKEQFKRATPALLLLLGLKKGDRVDWDAELGRFRINGRLVSIETTRRLLRQIEDISKADAKRLTTAYFAGSLTADEWERRMQSNILSSHWASAALFVGGLAAATGLYLLSQRVNREYNFLGKFKIELIQNKVSQPKAVNRAGSYSMAGALTGDLAEMDFKKNPPTGGKVYNLAKRVRTAKESCEGCIQWAGKWYPIDEIPELGSLQCRQYCRCYIIYKVGNVEITTSL